MDPRELIEQNVELIDRLAGRACRRVGVAVGDVGDVASMVKLALVENDYAILRRYEGRSSLATYLTIVIQRLLADQRERTHGRWRPSPDGARLPVRAPRPREVELPAEDVAPLAAKERSDTNTLDGELRDLSRRAGALLRETMDAWPADDRLLVRLRFESSLSIADIARLMHVPQRPLYRRIESLLARLRAVLLKGGIDPATADELVGASQRIEMDYGLAWKNGGPRRTNESTGSGSQGAQP
jgi:RNA polymerase sigma factor (sigma-70 family)